MKTIAQFAKDQRLTMEAEWTDSNPNMDDMPDGSSHWNCTINSENGNVRFHCPFSMGSAHNKSPEIEDVLSCLASDSASVDNASSFEEWAADLGYDTDSRKAFATYGICERQALSLKTELGETAYQELLYDCEPL